VKGTDVVKVKDFPGGQYAVMTTELSQIAKAWKELVAWCRGSDYAKSTRQCLEEPLELPTGAAHNALKIDIMLPIEAA
jgi:DNA gyrase inhibitor GyrI